MKHFLMVPNLDKWQHYKRRNPPWIKLHRDILSSYDFSRLPDASKAHIMAIWLLASQMDNRLPDDSAWLANRINATEPVDIDLLISAGFLEKIPAVSDMLAGCKQDASDMLAGCKQDATPEPEAEPEAEPENSHAQSHAIEQGPKRTTTLSADGVLSKSEKEEAFERIWKAYPNKQGKKRAKAYFMRMKPTHDFVAHILARLESQKSSDQWTRDGGRYIPHGSTWFCGERWDDELTNPQKPQKGEWIPA